MSTVTKSRRSSRAAVAAAPVALLSVPAFPAMSVIGDTPPDPGPPAPVKLDRFFRVVVIGPNKVEEVAEPACAIIRPCAFVRTFNLSTDTTGWRAEAREIDPASFRLAGEVRRALDLRTPNVPAREHRPRWHADD